jgi:hypothetical protein
VTSIGPGAAYYLQPANVYLSATLAFTTLTLKDARNENRLETETGFGVSAMVGKEWWVSTNWGLGAALQLQLGTMKDRPVDRALVGGGDPPRWTTTAFTVAFSATYN